MCIIEGCHKPAKISANGKTQKLCEMHAKRFLRNGCPTTPAVTLRELKPYLIETSKLLQRHDRERSILAYAREIWEAYLSGHVRETFEKAPMTGKLRTNKRGVMYPEGASLVERLEMLRTGEGITINRYKAHCEIMLIAEGAKIEEIFEVVAAMHLLQRRNPQRFHSDRAFRFAILKHLYRISKGISGGSVWVQRRQAAVKTSRGETVGASTRDFLSSELMHVFAKPLALLLTAISEEAKAMQTAREAAIEAAQRLAQEISKEAIIEEMDRIKQQLINALDHKDIQQ